MAIVGEKITFDTNVRNQFVKEPRWNEGKQEYICQHCGGIVPTQQMAYGFSCPNCGLPTHGRL